MVEAYWTIGKEIAETMGDRTEYGRRLIAYLSRSLTAEYGKGFSEANLRNMRQFYRAFPIRYALRSELSWTHYRYIMRVESPEARDFYVSECAASNWSERELKRQIDTHLYERLLHTQEAEALQAIPDSERAASPVATDNESDNNVLSDSNTGLSKAPTWQAGSSAARSSVGPSPMGPWAGRPCGSDLSRGIAMAARAVPARRS